MEMCLFHLRRVFKWLGQAPALQNLAEHKTQNLAESNSDPTETCQVVTCLPAGNMTLNQSVLPEAKGPRRDYSAGKPSTPGAWPDLSNFDIDQSRGPRGPEAQS